MKPMGNTTSSPFFRYDAPAAGSTRTCPFFSTMNKSQLFVASALMLLTVAVEDISPDNPSASNGLSPSHSFSSQTVATPAFCAEVAKQKGCDSLPGECLDCSFDCNCVYGSNVTVDCFPKKNIDCRNGESGPKRRSMICRYCYQSPPEEHVCEHNSTCQVGTRPTRKCFVPFSP